ncbi:5-methyltetrahydropteroyltriglutamate--homocysteine methyltransferase [Trichinella pseudospiralis]
MTQLGTFEQSKSMRNFTNSNFVNNRINDDRYPAFTLTLCTLQEELNSLLVEKLHSIAYKLYANVNPLSTYG